MKECLLEGNCIKIKDLVANLWREPRCLADDWVNRNLETQALYGDKVSILEDFDDFAYVEVHGQEIYTVDSGWSLYKGYMQKKALGVLIDERTQVFQNLDAVSLAKKFLGSPYLWGGCSFPSKEKTQPLRGVDCSGLVHLVYRQLNRRLPRNAHDQFLRTKPARFDQMKPGDLLFSSSEGMSGRIDHVMMVSHNDHLIESVMKEGVVREISFKEKFGCMPKSDLSSQMIGDLAVHTHTIP